MAPAHSCIHNQKGDELLPSTSCNRKKRPHRQITPSPVVSRVPRCPNITTVATETHCEETHCCPVSLPKRTIEQPWSCRWARSRPLQLQRRCNTRRTESTLPVQRRVRSAHSVCISMPNVSHAFVSARKSARTPPTQTHNKRQVIPHVYGGGGVGRCLWRGSLLHRVCRVSSVRRVNTRFHRIKNIKCSSCCVRTNID